MDELPKLVGVMPLSKSARARALWGMVDYAREPEKALNISWLHRLKECIYDMSLV